MTSPTAPEILLKLAEQLEAEIRWAAALNRPERIPFEASNIDAQECHPLRMWLAALDPANVRALATSQTNAERFVGQIASVTDETLGRAVHASWRDGMLQQGRTVEKERMSWETLPARDKALDMSIGGLVLLAALNSPAPTPQPDMSQNPEKTNISAGHVAPLDISAAPTPQPAPDALRDTLESFIRICPEFIVVLRNDGRYKRADALALSLDEARALMLLQGSADEDRAAFSAPQLVPDNAIETFGGDEVLGRAGGYVLTRNYLWAPSGDAVVDVVNGQLEVHPDLMDELEKLSAQPDSVAIHDAIPQPAPDALREALRSILPLADYLAQQYPETEAGAEIGVKARAALAEAGA